MDAEENYLHAVTTLQQAVGALVGPGNLRSRLGDAYNYNLVTLFPRHLPEHLRADFEQLKKDMTWIPVTTPGEGRVCSTLREMSEDEAISVARRIVEMYFRVMAASYERGNDEGVST